MATAVVMPRIGYEMVRGSVVRWLKREGDRVQRGEPIAEVETDKAIVELEAEQDGTLISIAAPEGATVSVGDIVAYIGEAGEATDDQDPSAESPSESGAERPRGLRSGFPPRLPGPDGRIPLGRMGQAIARRTQSTMAETPHFYLTVRIDMTDALELPPRAKPGVARVPRDGQRHGAQGVRDGARQVSDVQLNVRGRPPPRPAPRQHRHRGRPTRRPDCARRPPLRGEAARPDRPRRGGRRRAGDATARCARRSTRGPSR